MATNDEKGERNTFITDAVPANFTALLIAKRHPALAIRAKMGYREKPAPILMPTKPKPKPSAKQVLKDPAGGLTQAGREHFKKTEGANLKPGVKGPADTPEKMKRKGSFLRRHFANPNAGPLEDEKGKPTRHALSAQAWGEPLPKTKTDVKKLADEGSKLLKKYHEASDASVEKKPAAKKRKG